MYRATAKRMMPRLVMKQRCALRLVIGRGRFRARHDSTEVEPTMPSQAFCGYAACRRFPISVASQDKILVSSASRLDASPSVNA